MRGEAGFRAAVWLCGQGSRTMVWAASPVKGCGEAVWAAGPCFPVRGPRILLQNLQNPGKWPRFSLLHQVFKTEIWAISLIVARSGTDFVGRNGCFRLLRPTGHMELFTAIEKSGGVSSAPVGLWLDYCFKCFICYGSCSAYGLYCSYACIFYV